VSTRAPRPRVDAPRPASAWLLVVVASATLWITGQLEPWAIAVQLAAILGSFARRRSPLACQRSPIALNLAMAAIVAAAIAVAPRGGPATIPLAHFAVLTQGLQLLDARPRRTEFMLVTLALFQVILASNLTDSVLFTPLLAAFLLASVWTLLVHTLRSEAIEAGDPHSVTRAITPGLLRTTLLASGLSLVLALALFTVLPRLRSSVVTGPSFSSPVATAGFSESVVLGTLGRIRQDRSIALRVETLEGRPPDAGAAYWRGLAFDEFDGSSWSITPPGRSAVPGSPELGLSFGRDPDGVNLVQRIVREPVQGGVLFGVGEVRGFRGTARRLARDTSGGLYAASPSEARVRYTIATQRRSWRDEDLRRDVAIPPRRGGERYLQLPELSQATGALARQIARGAATDADRVRALESYLLRNGRYTDHPLENRSARAGSPVEAFLLGKLSGHCEYFASAMVLLARSLGIPARLVNGFAGGEQNQIGGFVELTRSDAHAWVEVHYQRAGWVRYDPTPPDLRARPAAALSLATRLQQLGSALELWWFQRVVGFDRADQIRTVERAWLAWKGTGRRPAQARKRQSWSLADWHRGRSLPWREGTLVSAGLGAIATLVWRLRRARARPSLHPTYARALRLLARRKLLPPASATARDFARTVSTALPGAAGRAFATLTEGYLAERFGGRPWVSAGADLHALRGGLRRGARRGRPRGPSSLRPPPRGPSPAPLGPCRTPR
jgi:hypothetical protein